MLVIDHVSKEYPTPRGALRILTDVSQSFDRGDSVSIMGPSGSGKSTLLYVAGALEPPTSGTVTLDGMNPFSLGEADVAAFRNRKIGFVFQDHCLLPQCSVLENVLTPALVAGGTAPYLERAKQLLNDVGLGERLQHRPGELSGGEKQRVSIARALLLQPVLLLCDEPTGNLDHTSAESVASLLFDLHARLGTILVIVTHSPQLGGRATRRFELRNETLVPVVS